MINSEKLERLMELEGCDDTLELLEIATFDSVVPGICINEDCDYTTQVEPDCRDGWCESCEAGTVVSAGVLGGLF